MEEAAGEQTQMRGWRGVVWERGLDMRGVLGGGGRGVPGVWWRWDVNGWRRVVVTQCTCRWTRHKLHAGIVSGS
mgnify:CR=1 FL=1